MLLASGYLAGNTKIQVRIKPLTRKDLTSRFLQPEANASGRHGPPRANGYRLLCGNFRYKGEVVKCTTTGLSPRRDLGYIEGGNWLLFRSSS
jgi:hypothetical protein